MRFRIPHVVSIAVRRGPAWYSNRIRSHVAGPWVITWHIGFWKLQYGGIVYLGRRRSHLVQEYGL